MAPIERDDFPSELNLHLWLGIFHGELLVITSYYAPGYAVPSSPPGSFLPTRVTPRIPLMARPKKQIWRGVIRLKLLSSIPGIVFMEKMNKT